VLFKLKLHDTPKQIRERWKKAFLPLFPHNSVIYPADTDKYRISTIYYALYPAKVQAIYLKLEKTHHPASTG
jgi:hypothetical protein